MGVPGRASRGLELIDFRQRPAGMTHTRIYKLLLGLRVSEWVKYSFKGILINIPPLEKGGEGGFENLCNVDMLPYNISLKEISGNLLIKP